MKKALLIALMAGIASPAIAQENVPTLPMGGRITVGPGYSSRSIQNVFAQPAAVPFAIGNGCSYIMEDVNFNPGPWGTQWAGSRIITGVELHFQTTGWTGTPVFPQTGTATAAMRFILEFYDAGNYANANILPNATPFLTQTLDTDVGTGFGWTVNWTGLSMDMGARSQVYMALKCVDRTTGVRFADGTAGSAQPTGQTAAVYNPRLDSTATTVGSSLPDYGRDQGSLGLWQGGAQLIGSQAGNANDRRATAAAAPFNSMAMIFNGDAATPLPSPIDSTICGPDVGDGVTTRTGAAPTTAAKWVQFCTQVDAGDILNSYFDIDTEGSNTPVAIGLFDASGLLIASDDGSGSTGNSQLSFGLGRRAQAVLGQGQQYDGRTGATLLTAGPAGAGYILGIAPAGSTFGSGFTVTVGTPGAAGTYNVNLRTNYLGHAAYTSVAPLVNGIDYGTVSPTGGTIGSPNGYPGTPQLPGPRGVRWSKFDLDTAIDSTNFLDINCADLTDSIDNVLYVFNSAGDLVIFDDFSGPATTDLAQISFGSTTPRTYGANPIPFAGASGSLPAGTYYVADAFFPCDDLGQTPGTDRRWHVRGTNGSNLNVGFDIYAGSGGGAPPCDPDVNQDGNVDQDDVAYLINVVGGGDNPTGIDPDFNHDGNVDQDDIASLINVVAGGPCP